MNLNDEQRAALARFLGFREIALVSKRFAPSHRYLIDRDGTLEGEAQWNDADILLALLNRAAELGRPVKITGRVCDPTTGLYIWCADLGEDNPTVEGTPLEAVILAVPQLPESQGGGT